MMPPVVTNAAERSALPGWDSLPAEYLIPEVAPTADEARQYCGQPKHPVLVALAATVRAFDIPKHEFSDLLTAFRRDQTVRRYATFDDVVGYCKYSANPVGHLVLYVCGYRDQERQKLSDFTCTA